MFEGQRNRVSATQYQGASDEVVHILNSLAEATGVQGDTDNHRRPTIL